MFAGGDKDESGDQYFSSYFEAAYDVDVWGVNFTPSVGISHGKGCTATVSGFAASP